MKAIILDGFGGTEQLIYTELPEPVIKEEEVLVQVKAISINPVDVKTRQGRGLSGRLKEESPLILGWDISGTVTAAGKAVTNLKTGDEVFGMVNFPGHGKAYASAVAAPAAHLALKPAGISHEAAAAATLAALTAWQAMTQAYTLQRGQKVLVHSAAGGVGHFAVQIAKHLGAYVIGTSSAANKDYVLGIGADEHIDYQAQRFEEVVKDADFVLDTLGGENLERSIATLKPGGTLIGISGAVAPDVAQRAADKQVHAFFFLVDSNGAQMQVLAGLLEQGIIKPYVNRFAFEEMAAAHTQQESGKTKGKIVLTLS